MCFGIPTWTGSPYPMPCTAPSHQVGDHQSLALAGLAIVAHSPSLGEPASAVGLRKEGIGRLPESAS